MSAPVCGGYYLFSAGASRGAVPTMRRESAAGSVHPARVRPVLALRRQGLAPAAGHPHDREAITMMIWLEAAAGLILLGRAFRRGAAERHPRRPAAVCYGPTATPTGDGWLLTRVAGVPPVSGASLIEKPRLSAQ